MFCFFCTAHRALVYTKGSRLIILPVVEVVVVAAAAAAAVYTYTHINAFTALTVSRINTITHNFTYTYPFHLRNTLTRAHLQAIDKGEKKEEEEEEKI